MEKKFFITVEFLNTPILNRVMLFKNSIYEVKVEAQSLLYNKIRENYPQIGFADIVKIENEDNEEVAVGDVGFNFNINWRSLDLIKEAYQEGYDEGYEEANDDNYQSSLGERS